MVEINIRDIIKEIFNRFFQSHNFHFHEDIKNGVLYKRDNVLILIYYDQREGLIELSFRDMYKDDFSIENGELVKNYINYSEIYYYLTKNEYNYKVVRSKDGVTMELYKLRNSIEEYWEKLFPQNYNSFVSSVLKNSKNQLKREIRSRELVSIKSKANEAFSEKEFQKALELYRSVLKYLSDSEVKKMKYCERNAL